MISFPEGRASQIEPYFIGLESPSAGFSLLRTNPILDVTVWRNPCDAVAISDIIRFSNERKPFKMTSNTA